MPKGQINISSDDLNALYTLSSELDAKIEQAQTAYMQGLFVDIRSVVSKRIVKAQAAFERAALAKHRVSVKATRKNATETAPA